MARAAKSTQSRQRRASSLVLPTSRTIPAQQQRAQQQARRRRQTAKQVRRFESVVARVQVPRAALREFTWPSLLRPARWHPSRILSLLLLSVMVSLVVWVHYDPEWYVYREYVTFHDVTYHDTEALYTLIDVDSWNIFWLSTETIRKRLITQPTITDAEVEIALPHWITIDIQETEPVALWLTEDADLWLLPDGTALTKADERYDSLPGIIDPLREASLWGDPTQQQIDVEVLNSALVLFAQMPAIEQLKFDAGYGLNFLLPDSTIWVYWGDGANVEMKYNNLRSIERSLQIKQQTASIIDVRFENPVIR